MGSEPNVNPRLAKSKVSAWVIPAVNSSIFSLFIDRLDHPENNAKVFEIVSKEDFSPSKKTVMSSAKARWVTEGFDAIV